MSMIWIILLTLVAEAGGHCVSPAPEPARSASDATVRPQQGAAPSRSLSVARRSWHRACPGYWTLAGLEEFDTEEVDETWMVHLDAIASVPGSWLCLAWSRSRSAPRASAGIARPPQSSFPLRC
jgi:hypothetical protein